MRIIYTAFISLVFFNLVLAIDCIEESATCIEPGGERVINGISVYMECWKYSYNKRCKVESKDNCGEIDHNNCNLVEERCYREEDYGSGKYCSVMQRDFSCQKRVRFKDKKTKIVTNDSVDAKLLYCSMMCLDGNCDLIKKHADRGAANNEMISSIGQLAAAVKMKDGIVDGEKIGFNLFAGNSMSCAHKKLAYSNCCSLSGGWGEALGAKCSDDEKTLANSRKESKCVYVGEACTTKVMGKCIIKKETYCCFDSVLSKTLQVEGRAQLNKSFGDANNPACNGFALEEIEGIDFEKIDFSEYFDKEIVPKMTNIRGRDLEQKAKRRAKELMRENDLGVRGRE